MGDGFVPFVTLRSYLLSSVFQDALEVAGIEFFVEDSSMSALNPNRDKSTRGIHILVRESRLEEARRVTDAALQELSERQGFAAADESDSHCLACGAEMGADVSVCPKCGWTFEDDNSVG